jgi:dipeptidyl aminopeptidase/acylaminoacyl peptidase
MRLSLPCPIAAVLAGVLAASLPAPVAAQQSAPPSPRPLTAGDIYRFRDVGAGRLSPDGQWVAYAITTTDSVKDKRDTDLWMTSWDGARTVRLTSSPESESNPRWSPDNRYLAFVSGRYDAKGGQLWLLDRTGGEAMRLTDLKGGVSDYEWSPDGTRLVVVSRDPDPAEATSDSAKSKSPRPIVMDRYAFKRDGDGYLERRRSHLWVVTVATRAAEQITTGDFDDSAPRWSPDGTRLAFSSERSGPDPDRFNNSDLFVIEATPGATPRQLTRWNGPDESPAWSPDGRSIAYLQGSAPELSAYSQNTLAVIPADGGEPRLVAAALDRDVSAVTWRPDGAALRFLLGDDRAQHLAEVELASGKVTRLVDGRRVVTGYDGNRSGRLVLNTGTAARSAEVHALDGASLRALTHVNDSLFAALQVGTTEDVNFRNKDGLTVGGLLVKPYGFDPARKYPLLLRIHGGPNAQDQHLYAFERELFAAQGYLVLAVNYRGSSGRGQAWKKAIFADWGNKEVQDLLAGVDHVISLGFADPSRVGIGGWSYGGILTNYAIATTTRFKAATSGAGSSLQTSMYGTDQYIYQYENELGAPWKNPRAWEKVSYPFFKADRITTPTQFLGGEKDFNVPIAGSEQMYQALRSLGVPTQLVVYPGEFHGISRPSFVKDRYERYLGWYATHMGVKTP